ARLRAVVIIHPAGLGGRPLDGHRCTAIVNASWTASSATSMSPKWRTRTATARPYSSRYTRSISEAVVAGTPAISFARHVRPPPYRRGGTAEDLARAGPEAQPRLR